VSPTPAQHSLLRWAFCVLGGGLVSIYDHGRHRRQRLSEHAVDAIIGLVAGMVAAYVLYLLTLTALSL
jgi:hypothetical protein